MPEVPVCACHVNAVSKSTPALPRGDATARCQDAAPLRSFQSHARVATGRCSSRSSASRCWAWFQSTPRVATGRCYGPAGCQANPGRGAVLKSRRRWRCHGAMLSHRQPKGCFNPRPARCHGNVPKNKFWSARTTTVVHAPRCHGAMPKDGVASLQRKRFNPRPRCHGRCASGLTRSAMPGDVARFNPRPCVATGRCALRKRVDPASKMVGVARTVT